MIIIVLTYTYQEYTSIIIQSTTLFFRILRDILYLNTLNSMFLLPVRGFISDLIAIEWGSYK